MYFIVAETRYQAKKIATDATVIAKVCGGYMAFDSYQEYKIWTSQR